MAEDPAGNMIWTRKKSASARERHMLLAAVKRRNSRIQREMIDGRPVYVKQLRPGGWLQTPELAEAQAAREIEIIRRVASLPGLTGPLGVVKIVDSDSESARVITEEVAGTPLQDLLRWASPKARRGSCVRALYLAGKWLRIFQTLPTESHVRVASPADPEGLIAYCDLRLTALMELQ